MDTVNWVVKVASQEQGIAANHTIRIEHGFTGMVVRNGACVYLLNPDNYMISAEMFPLLADCVVEKDAARFDAGLYLVRTNQIGAVNWENIEQLQNSPQVGDYNQPLSGTASVRIEAPDLFILGLLRLVQANQADASSPALSINELAYWMLASHVASAATEVIRRDSDKPGNSEMTEGQFEAEVRVALVGWLKHIGASCINVRVVAGDVPVSASNFRCSHCGAAARKTRNVTFYRNMSFFVVRLYATQGGYHCANCARSVFFAYNAANLTLGWWSMKGIVLTPIYVVMNTIALVTVLAGGKTPEDHAAQARADS